MKRSGHADLPLHYGRVPKWLAGRMASLGRAIVEAILLDYGKNEVIRRLSDPLWFQAFGAVLGMDWHSSGITTSVIGALKRSLSPISREIGIYVCGGRGKYSRQTPEELLKIAETTGLDGDYLVKCSKLGAKVDNTAIQDGYQLYLHSFILTDQGDWTIVQQGMNDHNSMARRYHWHSAQVRSFIEEPHSGVVGTNQGRILNLTHKQASATREGILELSTHNPDKMMNEIRKIVLPSHHEVLKKDVNLKRLGAVLATAYDTSVHDFESLLQIKGLGPRTLQSLTLVSEVIHGTPSRFDDPARFSFAHGGKDGHPFPVPIKIYDQVISNMKTAVNKAKIGNTDKLKALQQLNKTLMRVERENDPQADFDAVLKRERENSWRWGGRTVFGKAQKPPEKEKNPQLSLFD